ncbi:probable adenylate kinase 7, mitochondrial [Phragmites australis]|uniref:probable adenylate kinase 7, mitochondrial n=1 Tax=Phragmites australis TaxID=29695 RepID=UPI002D79A7A8|nr:probable adenylate kinase 7, mitochondrial [Phragmites australis]
MAALLRLAGAARSLSRRAPAPAPAHRRLAASAAALVEDYWTDWEDEGEEDARRNASAPVAESDPAGGGPRGVQWVVMGRPGPQKHAHAARLAEVLDVPYISMGTLVRQELNPVSQLYKKIANSVNEGRLVPEDIIFGLLTKRLEEGYNKGETGFILDGIPRTRMQAEILDEIVDIDLVLNFKCADDCFMKKRSRGDICSHCGQLFDVSNSATTNCSPCLGSYTWPAGVVGLEDSRMERMRTYAKQTKLLEDYYKKQRKILELKTSARPGETWQGLVAALHLQHLDAPPTPHKLTV